MEIEEKLNCKTLSTKMDELPEVIFLRVFSEFGFDDLRSVARVNKQWNRLAFDPSLRRAVDLHGLFLGHEDFSLFVDRISNSVICCDLRNCTGLSEEIIFKIMTECSRLKTLSLQGCHSFKSEGNFIYSSPPLCIKNLDLRFIQGNISKVLRSLLPHLRNIEALGIDYLPPYPHTWLQSLRNLKVFYCQDCATITDKDLHVLSSCNYIETLSLAGCTCISGEFLPLLIQACPRLSTLLLSCTRISNQFIMETDWSRSSITELDISYCYGITEEGLLNLMPRLSGLKYLQISFCGWGRALSDDVILKMAKKISTDLETLDVHSNFNLSGHALCQLLSNSPNMLTLCVGSAINSEAELEAALKYLPKLKTFFITKQSTVKTEDVFNLIAKYCPELESLALYNFYAINRSKVQKSLLGLIHTCERLKTLCIRGTNVALRTELIALAGLAKIVCGRRDIRIVRSPHMLFVGPSNTLYNVMQTEFKYI